MQMGLYPRATRFRGNVFCPIPASQRPDVSAETRNRLGDRAHLLRKLAAHPFKDQISNPDPSN